MGNSIYFSGTDASVKLINEKLNSSILDIKSISWDAHTPDTPDFDYKGRTPKAYIPGPAMAAGSLVLNMHTSVQQNPDDPARFILPSLSENYIGSEAAILAKTEDLMNGEGRTLVITIDSSKVGFVNYSSIVITIKDVHFENRQMVVSADGEPGLIQYQFKAATVTYSFKEVAGTLPSSDEIEQRILESEITYIQSLDIEAIYLLDEVRFFNTDTATETILAMRTDFANAIPVPPDRYAISPKKNSAWKARAMEAIQWYHKPQPSEPSQWVILLTTPLGRNIYIYNYLPTGRVISVSPATFTSEKQDDLYRFLRLGD